MQKEDFIKLVNQTRKQNKQKWYAVCAQVEGVEIRLKAFGLYVQRIEVHSQKHPIRDGKDCSSVAEFNRFLAEIIN